jgi:hypothetical protein
MKTFYRLLAIVFVTFMNMQIGYAQTPKLNEAYSRGVAENLDWIEVYNPLAAPLDISGYKIYDNGGQAGSKPKKLFPAGTLLPAKGFYAIITDTADFPGDLSGFGLSSGGETVWLEDASGTLIDSLVIPALGIDTSYARIPDGSNFITKSTPLTKGVSNILIKMNEVYSRGVAGNLDWIEIYNSSASSIDVSGYKIYDSGGQAGSKPKKLLPAGTILGSKGFYVVITDTADFVGDLSGFGLSSGGETVWLENASGTLIDTVAIPALGNDTSYARVPDGSGVLTKTTPPSKGATNVFGWWLFDNALNLTAAVPGYGSDLVLTGTHLAVAGPNAGNGATRIGIGSYYKLTHNFPPNGGGSYINEYSLMFDFKIPALGPWYTFFQTNMTNANDADFFIKPTGEIGQGNPGYSTLQVTPDVWYRLIVSVDLGNFFRYYLNGALIHEGNVQDIDGQFSLDPWLLLFADNDGEDAEFDIAEVAIWNRALSAQDALALGSVGTVIPVELTSFTAQQSFGNVTLLWSTATELNNKGFQIERKSQQDDWKVLGFIKGVGTTTAAQNYSFVDKPGNSGKYSYRLKQIDFDGTFAYSDAIEVEIRPTEFILHDNYPNPFNPSTIISYELPTDAFVSLRVYNSNGELVAELVNEYQISGRYNKAFSISSQNHMLSSGVYFAELKANQMVKRIKMMLLK